MADFTLLFFGKTGTGKSSTLNTLFGLNMATDNAVACTKEPIVSDISKSALNGLELTYSSIQVVDMPGIGESVSDDEKYLPLYENWIPKTDSLVWVVQADTRAYKRDEIFLLKLMPLFPPSLSITVALNKIDCLGVDDTEEGFDAIRKQPSEAQLESISDKIDDIYRLFKSAIREDIHFCRDRIIPYTSEYGWGVQNLKEKALLLR